MSPECALNQVTFDRSEDCRTMTYCLLKAKCSFFLRTDSSILFKLGQNCNCVSACAGCRVRHPACSSDSICWEAGLFDSSSWFRLNYRLSRNHCKEAQAPEEVICAVTPCSWFCMEQHLGCSRAGCQDQLACRLCVTEQLEGEISCLFLTSH